VRRARGDLSALDVRDRLRAERLLAHFNSPSNG
jgi:hypothetical protein